MIFLYELSNLSLCLVFRVRDSYLDIEYKRLNSHSWRTGYAEEVNSVWKLTIPILLVSFLGFKRRQRLSVKHSWVVCRESFQFIHRVVAHVRLMSEGCPPALISLGILREGKGTHMKTHSILSAQTLGNRRKWVCEQILTINPVYEKSGSAYSILIAEWVMERPKRNEKKEISQKNKLTCGGYPTPVEKTAPGGAYRGPRSGTTTSSL